MSIHEIKTKKFTKQIEKETKPLKLTNLYILYYLVNVHARVYHTPPIHSMLAFIFYYVSIQYSMLGYRKRKDQTGQPPSKIITIIDNNK